MLGHHSAKICEQCHQLLDLIDTLELKLKLTKGEVHNLYFNSIQSTDAHSKEANKNIDLGNIQTLGTTVKSSDDISIEINKNIQSKLHNIELIEPPKKKDKGLLTSTDLKCQICNKTFEKRRYLMDHLRRVHNSAIHQVKESLYLCVLFLAVHWM